MTPGLPGKCHNEWYHYYCLNFYFFKHRTLTSLRQKRFCYRVVDHWNNLTEEIVTAKTVTSFKTLLDKHLVHERFDTSEIY